MFLCGSEGLECTKISAPARLGILLLRVKPIFAGLEFSNHGYNILLLILIFAARRAQAWKAPGPTMMTSMTHEEYVRCARRIRDALQLEAGERVLVKLDPRTFTPLIELLQQEIRNSGAILFAAILAEET